MVDDVDETCRGGQMQSWPKHKNGDKSNFETGFFKFKELGPFKMRPKKYAKSRWFDFYYGWHENFLENHVTGEKLVTRYREVLADQYFTVRGT